MANTATVNTQVKNVQQFQGLYNEMWTVKATISDQDAITATDTMSIALTVSGVALGDQVIAKSISNDLSDGTDQAVFQAFVTAADTVTLRFTADAGAYAADDLNTAVVRLVVGRPTW